MWKTMVKLHDKIQAIYAAPMTPLLLVGSGQLCWYLLGLYSAMLATINKRSRRWSISPFDAGHTSVASACCVVSLQALTPPHSNPEREPEWQYHHHRISCLFYTFPNAFMTYLRFRWQEYAWPWLSFWSKRTPKLRDLRYGDFCSHIMLEIVSANFLTMMDDLQYIRAVHLQTTDGRHCTSGI
jgi:hypothetical protein